MNTKSESEIIADDEINLYDYWKILVKRKKIFVSIFLVPLAIVTIVTLCLPRYYRGESEISVPAITASAITAPNIVRLFENMDDAQKSKIFTNNPGAIKSVSVLLSKKSTEKVSIIVDAKTADIIPPAVKDMFDYINNLPEIKGEIARIQAEADLKTERIMEETDFKIKKLIEARKANLIFLNDMSDMIKKRKLSIINVNPADLIKKDAELSLEIINLQHAKTDMMKKKDQNVKVTVGILAPPSITKQPAKSRIKQIIMITGLLSLFAGIFVVFFLEYIDRMKAREKLVSNRPQCG